MQFVDDLFQWNYGAAGNLSKAKSMIAAIKASGFHYGIYSSPGVWSNIFGSYGVVLDSSAPLWFATWNGAEVCETFLVNARGTSDLVSVVSHPRHTLRRVRFVKCGILYD